MIFLLHLADHTSSAVQCFLKGFSFLLGMGSSLAFFATISVASGRQGSSSKEKLQVEEKERRKTEQPTYKQKLEKAINKSLLLLEQFKEESGSPGLVCAVSVNGELVMDTGLGFCDVENGVRCHSGNLMRIASISKALTSIAVGMFIPSFHKLHIFSALMDLPKPLPLFIPKIFP